MRSVYKSDVLQVLVQRRRVTDIIPPHVQQVNRKDPPMLRVIGPPIAAIGWIPFLNRFPSMQENAFHQLISEAGRFRKGPIARGFHELFRSGNAAPPPNWEGPDDFENYLAMKDYRGALCIGSEVTLLCDEDERPVDVAFSVLPEEMVVGYTCHRNIPFANAYEPGEGYCRVETKLDALGATITYYGLFRLNRASRFFGWLFVGSRGPYAGLQILYRIQADGVVETQIIGTSIPSQAAYLKWAEVDRYRMERASADDIRWFLFSKTDYGAFSIMLHNHKCLARLEK